MNTNYPGKVPTEQLAAEYQAGATLADLGKRYGLSKQAIAQRFAYYGIARRPKRGLPHRYPRSIPLHTCPGCGKSFRPPNRGQICCSIACRDKIKPRKAFCKHGHPRTPENLYRGRVCRKCICLNAARYRAKKRCS